MGVFLPELEDGDGDDVPEHKVVIEFPLARVGGVNSVNPGAVSYWFPQGHEVRFTYDGDTQDRDLEIAGFDRTAPGGFAPQPISTSPTHDFSWVLSVGDALRGLNRSGARVRRELKRSLLDPGDAAMLGARMMLTRGKVSVEEFSREDNSLVVWRLRPENQPDDPQDHQQFAATVVVVEIDVPAPSIHIMARDLRPLPGTEKEIAPEFEVVELVPEDLSQPVVVRIFNEEANAVLGLGSQPEIQLGAVRGQDRIFQTVAMLLEDDDGKDPFPVPVAAQLIPPRRGRSGVTRVAPPCSPLRTDG